MSPRSDYEALVERLRAELTQAEERFREATTPEEKQKALGEFEQALFRYSHLLLDGKLPSVQ